MSEHDHNWGKSFLETLESIKIEEIFHENTSNSSLWPKLSYYYFGESYHKKAKKNDQKIPHFPCKMENTSSKKLVSFKVRPF